MCDAENTDGALAKSVQISSTINEQIEKLKQNEIAKNE